MYAYDTEGHLASVTQGTRTMTPHYDARGNVDREEGPGGTTSFGYDTRDQLTTITEPDGRVRQFDRGARRRRRGDPDAGRRGARAGVRPHRPTRCLHDAGRDRLVHVDHDADGRRQALRQPSGAVVTRTYDAQGRLIALAGPDSSVGRTWLDTTARLASQTWTGGGSAETESFTYTGSRLASLEWAGAVPMDPSRSPTTLPSTLSGVTLTRAGVTTTVPVAVRGDGLLSTFGPFSYQHFGAGGALSAISDGTGRAHRPGQPGFPVSRSLTVGGTTVASLATTYDTTGLVMSTMLTAGATSTTSVFAGRPKLRIWVTISAA